MRTIYLDNNATTAVDPRVLDAMLPYFHDDFGNPSSVHRVGQKARRGMDDARENLAASLGVAPKTIIFTSGGSESNNQVLYGLVQQRAGRSTHIITTPIEHDSVRRTAQLLENLPNVTVTWLPVDRYGMVDPDEVKKAITPETALVSVMYANNEVGTIQPLAEIAEITREAGVPLHSDAVQAAGKIDVKPVEIGVDLMTLCAHKIHGPKGIGLLYVREGLEWPSLIIGGKHERLRRAGTENVAGIVGFAKCWELCDAERREHPRHIAELRDQLQRLLVERIDDTLVTGHPTQRTANTLHVCFRGLESEALLMNLDLRGVAVSSGSACASGSREASHVLAAMGVPEDFAFGAVRFSLSRETTEEEIRLAADAVVETVETLRTVGDEWETALP